MSQQLKSFTSQISPDVAEIVLLSRGCGSPCFLGNGRAEQADNWEEVILQRFL